MISDYPGSVDVLTQRVHCEREKLLRIAALITDVVDGDARFLPTARHYDSLARDLATELDGIAALAAGRKGDTISWDRLNRLLERAEKVVIEAQCFLESVLYRVHLLDRGSGDAADAFLAYLGAGSQVRHRIVTGMSAGSASINHTLDLVRLPFPAVTVWDLPVVAHEFGHHLVRELRHVSGNDERPLKRFTQDNLAAEVRFRKGDPQASADADAAKLRLEETAADAYATYTLGPAYAYACLVLRVDPTRAMRSPTTHPSWCRRIHLAAAVLRAIKRRTGRQQYAQAADCVEALWRSMTDSPPVAPRTAAHVARHADVLVECLARHAHDALYDAGSRPASIMECLTADGEVSLPSGTTPAHVVNAAWSWRLGEWDRFSALGPRVNARALKLICSTSGP
ncbi:MULTISPECIES: hypothetical protein [unclassified Streptomyces]|uniref:hypothetical protein n=1 Tax=unclassified Streptomyces TaxID=2593676 RepID=UPI002E81B47D|nr:hypothetical protein [Streptomyces sp. NBC_00589]WTI35356.1 hypothetical protein OIC96_10340 [Streptomyces sp. NBC_00775]WUB30970.1 hypothetical protein OHA51_39390 [Streptomyces sp. NBC_00589]